MREQIRAFLVYGVAFCILVSLPILVLSGLYSLKFGDCVRLPNGTEIGYEAYIDFSRPYLIPDAAVRDQHGVVIALDVWPIHVTSKATIGRAVFDPDDDQEGFQFIWTAETGVIKKAEQPELYHSLSQDLGDTYYGAPKSMNTNTLGLYYRLMKEGRFKSNRCSTALLTW